MTPREPNRRKLDPKYFLELPEYLRSDSISEQGARIIRESETEPTPSTEAELTATRNGPCPCGSGKKYKKCCMRSGK